MAHGIIIEKPTYNEKAVKTTIDENAPSAVYAKGFWMIEGDSSKGATVYNNPTAGYYVCHFMESGNGANGTKNVRLDRSFTICIPPLPSEGIPTSSLVGGANTVIDSCLFPIRGSIASNTLDKQYLLGLLRITALSHNGVYTGQVKMELSYLLNPALGSNTGVISPYFVQAPAETSQIEIDWIRFKI